MVSFSYVGHIRHQYFIETEPPWPPPAAPLIIDAILNTLVLSPLAARLLPLFVVVYMAMLLFSFVTFCSCITLLTLVTNCLHLLCLNSWSASFEGAGLCSLCR